MNEDSDWIDAEVSPPTEPGEYETQWKWEIVEGILPQFVGRFDGQEWVLETVNHKKQVVLKKPGKADKLVKYRPR